MKTSYTISFSEKARKEFLGAWSWYEDRQAGLGSRFRNEVYKQVYKIEQYPELYTERKKNYRETRVEVFPYLIVFRIKKRTKEILIVSIFHSSRNQRKKYAT